MNESKKINEYLCRSFGKLFLSLLPFEMLAQFSSPLSKRKSFGVVLWDTKLQKKAGCFLHVPKIKV